jgi:dipicolinate synthase subunit B
MRAGERGEDYEAGFRSYISRKGDTFVNKPKIGWAFCGSFCTFENAFSVMEKIIADGAAVTPIFSETAANTDTRFGKGGDWVARAEEVTGHKAILDITGAEPIGPNGLFDLLIVAPATGNTLAKLAHGITDGTVTMACKSHLRNGKPLLLAISTNDGLSGSALNIALLTSRKNIFFVPYRQDNAQGKPSSLVADLDRLAGTIGPALSGEQTQPLLLTD